MIKQKLKKVSDGIVTEVITFADVELDIVAELADVN